MKKKLLTASIVLVLLVPFLFGGCGFITGEEAANSPDIKGAEGFAIYLTRFDIPPSRMEMQSHVELADKPVISRDDILSYNWDTHVISLTAEAYQKLEAMKIPVNGVSFLVCVDKKPLYWGAFWTPVSSLSFDGITITLPSMFPGENIVKLEPGYPGPAFYSGKDPRDNPSILEALEKAGKLK